MLPGELEVVEGEVAEFAPEAPDDVARRKTARRLGTGNFVDSVHMAERDEEVA